MTRFILTLLSYLLQIAAILYAATLLILLFH